ncbi:MAG: family 10 glycosylhydrolase [Oscillospiraceae bacterium]|nr:family 10 glycosylhydrolase [Oscillospiraceae bacterium]
MKLSKIISVTLLFSLLSFAACKKNGDETASYTSHQNAVVEGYVSEYYSEYPGYFESVDFMSVIESENKSESSEKQTSSKNKVSSKDKTSSKISSVSSVKPSSNNSSNKTLSQTQSSASTSKINYDTMKAVWISYIDFADILTNKTESQFKTAFDKAMKNCKDFNINTVVCQVRQFSDAVYPSQYFAWAANVKGIGKNPGYDPLKIMVEIAHKYNLSFQAWINPFRAYLNGDVSKVPDTSIFKKWYNDSSKKGLYVIENSGRWYYNPAEPEVRKLIVNGVKEIIENYDVDGVHLDDYFYPTTDASFDAESYKNYANGQDLASWRRQNVNTLVKEIYNTVKKQNSNILFGISPQGNINNNMDQQYADVKLWGKTAGYVDYICPQIYYNYKSESSPYLTTLNDWKNLITSKNVKLIVGLAPYRAGYAYDMWACTKKDTHTSQTENCGAYGWIVTPAESSDILARQYVDAMNTPNCSGVMLFSYKYVFNIDSSFISSDYTSLAKEQAQAEMQKLKNAMK